MKKVLSIPILLFVFVPLFAQIQPAPYLWPIEGANAGDNIISAPQSDIDGELNFDNLFIGASEGTNVLSPVDGTIISVGVGYLISLTSSVGCNYGEQSFDESLKNRDKYSFIPGGSKYFHGALGIRSKDGKMIWFRGLSGSEIFKTGQTIKRGTPIGKVAYSYFKIEKPSIIMSISIGGKPADPMTPFNIKSSFIPPEIEAYTFTYKKTGNRRFYDLYKYSKRGVSGIV